MEHGYRLQSTPSRENMLAKYGGVALVVVVLAWVIVVVLIVRSKHHHINNPSPSPSPSPSNMDGLTQMCQVTQYPDLCVKTLGEHYMNNNTQQGSIVEVSLNVTLDRVKNALDYLKMEKNNGVDQENDSYEWSAHDDCVELMEDSMDLLTQTQPLLMTLLSSSNTPNDDDHQQSQSDMMDLKTWMSTICTNQDTCTEGFKEVGGPSNDRTAQILQELTKIVSNHLALSSSVLKSDVVSGRRLMDVKPTLMDHKNLDGPKWMSRINMELLTAPLNNIRPNIVVSQDGIGPEGTVRTIVEAIEKAPTNSPTPFIIYVKAGRYHELNLKVDRSKNNIWFIGDGKGKTIITGNKSTKTNKVTTIQTPTFGTTGNGFVARGITFENTAGSENHQAVALYVKSDKSVFYECEMKGYQDTLYVHSNRQFYRNCDIYGTVDYIFGNAQAVLQYCYIYARKPIKGGANTITAQKRSQTCPDSCSGISIHHCNILATSELEPVKADYPTYLGRPWRELSTVVYMLSYIGDHVNPQGWLPWNGDLPDTVYYGEFQNHGPGANTSKRIRSPGIHVKLSNIEAARFTVQPFIGDTWIAQTNVPFEAGL